MFYYKTHDKTAENQMDIQTYNSYEIGKSKQAVGSNNRAEQLPRIPLTASQTTTPK